MSGWKWQYADIACSCLSKREKAEPSASDNCRICSCCFKTQFGNFKSGWISSENMFVAPTRTRKRWNVTKIGRPSDKRTFRCPVDEGATKVETAVRFFCNWTRQRTMNSDPGESSPHNEESTAYNDKSTSYNDDKQSTAYNVKITLHNEKTTTCNDESTAYKDESTAYKDERTAYDYKRTAYNDKGTAYNDESTAYNYKCTTYNNKSTTYNWKSTGYNIKCTAYNERGWHKTVLAFHTSR